MRFTAYCRLVNGVSDIEKIETLPAMSINLKFLNVGSAAALATTVTGIPLSRHKSKGWVRAARDCNRVYPRRVSRSSGLRASTRAKYLKIRDL